jgi:large subunit ribosomal protein L10
MKKELKEQIIESISAQLKETPYFYVTDISGLNSEQTSALRRECFKQGIKLTVVKNTLFSHVVKAMDNEEVKNILPTLVGNSAIMFTTVANAPAKLIKDFTKKNGLDKPALKAAYVQDCSYVGADKLGELASIKSKEELLGDIIAMLQSPAQNVISALESAGGKLAGIVKTLSEKEEK